MADYCGTCSIAFHLLEKHIYDKNLPKRKERNAKVFADPSSEHYESKEEAEEWIGKMDTEMDTIYGKSIEEIRAECISMKEKVTANRMKHPNTGEEMEPPGDGLGWTFLCEICGHCLVDEYCRRVPGLNAKCEAGSERFFGFDLDFNPVEREK